MFGEEGEGPLGREDACEGGAAGEIPPAQELEIAQRGRTGMAPPRAPWIAQEIEVVADEPHDAIGHQALEQIGADLVVSGGLVAERFSHVVEEGGGPEVSVRARVAREIEDLQGVKEGVAFRMVAWRLRDAIEREQEIEQLRVHLP
jgi:hypothetical protein